MAAVGRPPLVKVRRVANRTNIFRSVFPQPLTNNPVPTPTATPNLGFPAHDESFSSTEESSQPEEDASQLPEQVVWDRAWHTITSAFSLPEELIRLDEISDSSTLCQRWFPKKFSKSQRQALLYLDSPTSQGKIKRAASRKDEIREWYLNQVTEHWLQSVLGSLRQVRRLFYGSEPPLNASCSCSKLRKIPGI